jgi:hypothetical protein
MAINAKTKPEIDLRVTSESNNILVVALRMERVADKIDGVSDPALATLGYSPAEITQLKNWAIASHAVATAIDANAAAFESIADIILF